MINVDRYSNLIKTGIETDWMQSLYVLSVFSRPPHRLFVCRSALWRF